MSNAGNSSVWLSPISRSSDGISNSGSSPSISPSSSTSITGSSTSTSSSSSTPTSFGSSSCSRSLFLFEPPRDSLTNSLISSFIVEASIPFAFSLIAFSTAFICNRASSTIDFSFILIFYTMCYAFIFIDKYVNIAKKCFYFTEICKIMI